MRLLTQAGTVAGSFRFVTGAPDPDFELQSRARRRLPFRKATHRRAKSFVLRRLPRQQPVAAASQIVRGAILGSSMKSASQNDIRRSTNHDRRLGNRRVDLSTLPKCNSKNLDRMARQQWNNNSRFK